MLTAWDVFLVSPKFETSMCHALLTGRLAECVGVSISRHGVAKAIIVPVLAGLLHAWAAVLHTARHVHTSRP
jgi:hypothetical protein